MITFQRKNHKALFLLILLASLLRCQNEEIYTYSTTKKCNNLTFSAGLLFPKETIELYYNDEIILKHLVDSLDGYRFNKEFCIDYKPSGTFKVKSIYKDKVYIDTIIKVKKEEFGYHLVISLPHPKNWKDYYENNSPVPTKEWGYLPINKCIRFISLVPDTVYRNSFTDNVLQ